MLSIIDYKKSKKDLLIDKTVAYQVKLIENMKEKYGYDFKNRLSLQELRNLNELIYQILEEKNKLDIYFEYMDKVVSICIFYSIDSGKFDISLLKQGFGIINMEYMILTGDDLKKLKQQIESIFIETKIISLKNRK